MACLTGKRVAMIVAARNFRDEELQEPRAILEKAGASVTLVSTTLAPARGMLGATVRPDILLSDLNIKDYDAIVFVGGTGASQYWDNPQAHRIVREAVATGKVVGAICIAPVTLARAGVLKEKKATVYPSEKEKLASAGATVTLADVEIADKIITANGPGAAVAFGRALVKALAG